MAFPFAALFSAAAPLIGSLFGSGSKPQVTTNRVDYKRMVADAEAAGFNPLTALRNGGAAGFSISSTPAAPLSARLADGIAAGAQNFIANFDPFQDKMRDVGYRMAEAQLANLQADTAMRVRFGDVPTYTAGTQARRMGTPGTGPLAPPALGPGGGYQSLPQEVVTPSVTNPWPKSWGMEMHPETVDVGMWEEAAGEWSGQFIGFPIWAKQQLEHNAPRVAKQTLETSGGWINWTPAENSTVRRAINQAGEWLGFPPPLSPKAPSPARFGR